MALSMVASSSRFDTSLSLRLAAIIAVAVLAWMQAAIGASSIDEQVVKVPVKVRDGLGKAIEQEITVTVFEIPGRAPYPLLVLNHGRAPDAMGRAKLGRVRYSEAAADQVVQVIEYARRRRNIDEKRIVAVGQSFGGATSITLASRAPAGLVATINFAGGGGGDPVARPGEPCFPRLLEDMFRDYGKTSRIPTLWVYTENDLYFHPRHTKSWFEAFRSQGGVGEFMMLPAFGDNGHLLFTRGFKIWRPIVGKFLDQLGFNETR